MKKQLLPFHTCCRSLLPVLTAALGLILANSASAQTLYWYGDGTNLGGNGTWTATGGTQWSTSFTGGGNQAWTDNSTAAFRGAGGGTVTVSGTVKASSLDLSSTSVASGTWAFNDGTIELTGAGGVIARGTAGGTFAISSAITGSQGLTQTGNGIFTLAGSAKTYTGNTSFNSRTVLLATNVLPSGTIVTHNNDLNIRANQQFSGLSGGASTSFINVDTGGTRSLTLNGTSATPLNYVGRFEQHPTATNVLNLVKSGSYEQRITGTLASTSNGTVLISGGILALGKTDGLNALGSGVGAITVQTGGTLRLDQNNQLAISQNLVLEGGTFSLNGFSEGLNTLDLNANSVLTLGTGGTVAFGNSSALNWDSFTLTINGLVSGTTLRFGTNSTGLTAGQLANLRFANYGNQAGQIDSLGYVTAIPEPSSVALLFGAGVFIFLARRRAVSRRLS